MVARMAICCALHRSFPPLHSCNNVVGLKLLQVQVELVVQPVLVVQVLGEVGWGVTVVGAPCVHRECRHAMARGGQGGIEQQIRGGHLALALRHPRPGGPECPSKGALHFEQWVFGHAPCLHCLEWPVATVSWWNPTFVAHPLWSEIRRPWLRLGSRDLDVDRCCSVGWICQQPSWLVICSQLQC